MKSFALTAKSALLMIAFLAAGVVFAVPTPESGSDQGVGVPEGYTLGELRITGEINGVAVNHTGTVQEVIAKLDAEDNNFKLSDVTGLQSRSSPIDAEQLDRRIATDLHCLPVFGQTWHGADAPAISDGIAYLNKKGWDICNVGPHKCVRVSCSWNAAITVCNNQDQEINPTCNLVAAFAHVMLDRCTVRRGFFQHSLVGGQYWDNENWNVNIFKDRC